MPRNPNPSRSQESFGGKSPRSPMSPHDGNPASRGRCSRSSKRLWGTLGAKLLVLLGLSMALVFGLLGYLNIRLHRRHLERAAEAEATRMSSVIQRNTSYYMLRNQRDGLYHIIGDLANEPGVLRIRIINEEGRVSYSTDTVEIGRLVTHSVADKDSSPRARNGVTGEARQAIRTYRLGNRERALAVARPIENASQCSNAD